MSIIFPPNFNITNYPDLIATGDIDMGGFTLSNTTISLGGTTITGDISMSGNDLLGAGQVSCDSLTVTGTISALNYDYINSQTHTITDDRIILSSGGANQAEISTSSGAVDINKSFGVSGVQIKLDKGNANEVTLSATGSGLDVNKAISAIGMTLSGVLNMQNNQITNATSIYTDQLFIQNKMGSSIDMDNQNIENGNDIEAMRIILNKAGTNATIDTTGSNVRINKSIESAVSLIGGDMRLTNAAANILTDVSNTLGFSLNGQSVGTFFNGSVAGGNRLELTTRLVSPEIILNGNDLQTLIDNAGSDVTIYPTLRIGDIGTSDLRGLAFTNATDGDLTLNHTSTGIFEINKAPHLPDVLLGGQQSVQDTLFDVTVNPPGQTFDLSPSTAFYDDTSTMLDNSGGYVVGVCECEIFGNGSGGAGFPSVTIRPDPSDSASAITGTNGKKIYMEYDLAGVTAGNITFTAVLNSSYYDSGNYDIFTLELAPWAIPAQRLQVVMSDVFAFRPAHLVAYYPVVTADPPDTTQKLGILFDFVNNKVELINASTGNIFYTVNCNNQNWNDVKNGIKKMRLGLFWVGAGGQLKPYAVTDGDKSGYYDTITGTKEYYLQAYGGGTGSSIYDRKFYTKTETDALVGAGITADSTDVLTNKTINADLNTIVNIGDDEVSGLSATKIGNGDVDNTELSTLNGVTSGIQAQLDSKSTGSKTETLTNKTIDAQNGNNTIVNLSSNNIINLDASRVGTGSVDNAELDKLNGITENVQTALNSKSTETKTETLENKTISANQNTITNLTANMIGNGDVDNTKLSYSNSLTGNIQTQLNNKANDNAVTGIQGTTWLSFVINSVVSELIVRPSTLIMRGGGVIPTQQEFNMTYDPTTVLAVQMDRDLKLTTATQGKILHDSKTVIETPILETTATDIYLTSATGSDNEIKSDNENLKIEALTVGKSITLKAPANIILDSTESFAPSPIFGAISPIATRDYINYLEETFYLASVAPSGVYDLGNIAKSDQGLYINSYQVFLVESTRMIEMAAGAIKFDKTASPDQSKGLLGELIHKDTGGSLLTIGTGGLPLFLRPNHVRITLGGDGGWSGKSLFIKTYLRFNP